MEPHARKPGGRPARHVATATADRILDAARASFAARGVSGTSLDELARALGVSKHTIYRRFANKPVLLEAVVERDLHWFHTELSKAANGAASHLEAARRIAFRYVEIGVSRDHADFYLAVQAESIRSSRLRERLAAWSEVALTPLREALTRALTPGPPGVASSATPLEILVDLLEGLNNRQRLGAEATRRAELERAFDSRWCVFVAAFAPDRPDSPPPRRRRGE